MTDIHTPLHLGDDDALQIDIDFDGKRLPFANIGIVHIGGQLSGDSGERYRTLARDMRPYIVQAANAYPELLGLLREMRDEYGYLDCDASDVGETSTGCGECIGCRGNAAIEAAKV